MIVDLLRNDLGRVAETGSVRVASLLDVERYRTVHQLTSTVEARLRPGTGLAALLAATFPCGSVTGAPKAMATRIIAEEEGAPRGVYCGAIGFVAPGGDAAFNVAIRTVELDLSRGEAVAGVGGGITWASTRSGSGTRRSRRQRSSPPTSPRSSSSRRCGSRRGRTRSSGATSPGSRRRRATSRSRSTRARPSARSPARPPRPRRGAPGAAPPRPRRRGADRERAAAGAARRPAARRARRAPGVAARPALFHKTTRRGPYDAARRERPDAFDVLLANEEGELTELTIGNLVVDLDGEQVTPPREAGLLAGVMRAELLARGESGSAPSESRSSRAPARCGS